VTRFAKLTWGVFGFNILVVLWGAFVRATGSGAGCGAHWPLCNGEVIPRSPQVETIIEFSHRLSSGIAFILVAGVLIAAWRLYPKTHLVRRSATFSMIFMVFEALVGAGIVLFRWVADDDSSERVISISLHLIITFLLLAGLALTAWWASGESPIQFRRKKSVYWGFGIGFVGIILLGISGAITALGDTLFPSESLVEGIRQDFSATAHFLLRLRVWHPIIAVVTGFYVGFLAMIVAGFEKVKVVRRFAWLVGGLFVIQLGAGLINLVLLAPVYMQLIHLFLAVSVWVVFVLLAAETFKQPVSISESSL
jgi:heme A synthase